MSTHRQDAGNRSRAGGTLIETMVSSLLLAVIAVGSTAYLSHARSGVLQGRNQRVALEAVNQRLEEIRSSAYDDIKPPALTYGAMYISPSGTNWVHSNGDPGENVDLNGLPFPLTTTVQYLDADGGASTYDYVRVAVEADTRPGQAASVRMESFVSP